MIQLRRPNTNHAWFKRGWTYQEGLFSRRKLTFSNDAIFWDCPCSSFQEDLEPLPGRQHLANDYTYSHIKDFTLTSTIPDFGAYNKIASSYNSREFSFQEDAMAAFAGIMTVASQSFHGGFVCGLPVLFFDIALCWHFTGASTRRYSSKKSTSGRKCLPSWSWAGWQGILDFWCWKCTCDYVKNSDSMTSSSTSRRTISTVQWYSRQQNTTKLNPIIGPQIAHRVKTLSQESDYVLSPGWKRYQYVVNNGEQPVDSWARMSWPGLVPPNYFFKHESDPGTEFWYPLPVHEERQGPYLQTEDSILCGYTQKSRLNLAESLDWPQLGYSSLRMEDGSWAGIIQLNVEPQASLKDLESNSNVPNDQICDLVVISEGYFLEGLNSGWSIKEEYMEERPRAADGAKYEFYNVLSVEWEDDIAYRKGCGRVEKHLWDSLNPEWFDLVLG